MAELYEKVIKGLECCSQMNGECCKECPYAKECEEGKGWFVGSAHLAADALSLLKAQEVPDTNAGKWISVKDSLPENIKPVLVWESQGFAYVDNYLDGAWSIGSENGAFITHWMPLPEPPKEES